MLLEVHRDPSSGGCTLGNLFVDGQLECFTLEDIVREIPGVPVEKWKIPAQTAIPSGTYHVIVNTSQRFQKLLPLLLNVPGFAGVRIHSGNVAADTEGCILVGTHRHPGLILDSRQAFVELFAKIEAAITRGESVQIKITNSPPPNNPA